VDPVASAQVARPADSLPPKRPGEETAPAGNEVLPPDVPSYPGASVVSSSNATEQGLIVAFQSKDAPEKVFEFYRQQLADRGWSVEGEMSSVDQRMLIAGKGDRKASVLVSGGEAGETQFTLTVTQGEG
jgi:hypothetical protein